MSTNDPKVVRTGLDTRLSYANIWQPKAMYEGGEKQYSVSVLIPKSDKKTLAAITKAIDAAIEDGVGKFGGKIPNKKAIKLPLRDGDAERPDDSAYAEHYFINAKSKKKPRIVGRDVQDITDPDEVYSGCYARVMLNFYAFNTNGNKGVTAGLGNIQKVRDGEPLGGQRSPEQDFDTLEDEDFLSIEADDLPF